jgi:hypothetical protein
MTVSDTRIVSAVAEAMAGPLMVKPGEDPPFPQPDGTGKGCRPFPDTVDVPSFTKADINNAVLAAWDEDYLQLLAGEVCRILPKLEGFNKDDVVKVLERALLLLAIDRYSTFGKALEAAIVPELRPDMLTTMYVLKQPSTTETSAATATAPAQGGSAGLAQFGGKLVALAGAALQAPAAAMNAWLNPMGSFLGAGDGGGPGMQGGAGEDLSWLQQLAASWQLTEKPSVSLPDAWRFYEAQCGDSLHVCNVEFNLPDVVRASTAAPTFFAGGSGTGTFTSGFE